MHIYINTYTDICLHILIHVSLPIYIPTYIHPYSIYIHTHVYISDCVLEFVKK